MRDTLICLSKLYLSIDSETFDGIAQEAIGDCLASLKTAHKLIQVKNGELDGHLFLIQHLLILQQQIKSFDVNLIASETTLDFSNLLFALRLVVSRKIFSLSLDNPILQVVAQATPRIKTSQIDYKKDMEALLNTTVASFVSLSISLALETLLGWLAQATKYLTHSMQVMEGSLPPTAGLSPYHPKQVGIHEINFTTPAWNVTHKTENPLPFMYFLLSLF
eukprot:TRINITY_DN7195_c0_g1_i1.p1 TRINITY_DN7195_c0_g1~~TRINITY_DN7195_c0_g1_i1.p1  ORF type:complete len:220 (-),score=44.93 TRINITY_DN7195_c0_g1_i1:451-1110(-)